MFDDGERQSAEKALAYMDLRPGTAMRDIAVDTVFVGSCTNGRIEDLRVVADVLRGRKVADGVRMLVVPGSMRVRAQAESEGLGEIFTAAGARVAAGRLLDVSRHESRPVVARASDARRRPTATSRAGKARAAAPIWCRLQSPRPPLCAARCRRPQT